MWSKLRERQLWQCILPQGLFAQLVLYNASLLGFYVAQRLCAGQPPPYYYVTGVARLMLGRQFLLVQVRLPPSHVLVLLQSLKSGLGKASADVAVLHVSDVAQSCGRRRMRRLQRSRWTMRSWWMRRPA